jgi:hypothetical protein
MFAQSFCPKAAGRNPKPAFPPETANKNHAIGSKSHKIRGNTS